MTPNRVRFTMIPSSVLVRSPLVRVAERLQFALEVVRVDTVDGEARLLDDLGNSTCQMTPARERLPERFYPFLPPCDARIGRVAVFDEVERAAGLEDANQLGESPIDVRDRAQRPRGQRGIEAVGWEVQCSPVSPAGSSGTSFFSTRGLAMRMDTCDGSTA
jgi:hypothetical protein